MKELVDALFRRHRERLLDDYPNLLACWKSCREEENRRGIVGTASLPDCLFLYLLVVEYRPATIFEIGTFVGTTSIIMAEASGLRARIHTCDKRDVYEPAPRYEGVILPRAKTHSATASGELRKAGVKLDLVFADGRLDWRTARNIAAMMHPESVFATHDYAEGDKGVDNLERMSRRLISRGFRRHVPPSSWYQSGHDVGPWTIDRTGASRASGKPGPAGINSCIAVLLPPDPTELPT